LILVEAAKQKLEGDKQAAAEQLKMMEEQINAQQPGAFDNELKKIGMTREKIMDKLVEQSIIQQYVAKLAESAGKISAPTEKELKDFYEQNQAGMKEPAKLSAAHILIQFPSQKPTDDEKAAALKQIQDIRKQLKEDGSNFAELAKTHSACPISQELLRYAAMSRATPMCDAASTRLGVRPMPMR
ncbi:MAG: peptidylprolyl isomerase, partial [Alistipes sp.]|nr:peptidylprolyl isomerase [Alistipes sp.]